MKYNLSDYIVSIKPNDSTLQLMFSNLFIGGEGSMTDSISVERNDDLWTTEGFATGGWVHNKNLAKWGKVSINISQLSDRVAKFKQLCEIYYGGDYDGCTLSVIDRAGRMVASCIDCYITKIPAQQFGTTADKQQWDFTCGEINFI